MSPTSGIAGVKERPIAGSSSDATIESKVSASVKEAHATQGRCAAITLWWNWLPQSPAPETASRLMIPRPPSLWLGAEEIYGAMSHLQSRVWAGSSPMVGLPVLQEEMSEWLSCKAIAPDRSYERMAWSFARRGTSSFPSYI